MLSNIEEEIEILQRHVKVMKHVIENEPIGIIKLSILTGIPQHKIRYSLRILEQRGLIKPSPKGAVTTEKAWEIRKAFPKRMDALIEKMQKTRNVM